MAFTVATTLMECFDLESANSHFYLGGKWDAASTANGFGTTYGRRGSSAASFANAGQYMVKTVTAAQDFTFNFSFAVSNMLLGAAIVQLLDGTTAQCDLRMNATTGTLSFTRNGTVLATSTSAFIAATVYAVEVLVHIATGTNGWADVNVNGVNWIHLTGANTANAGTTQATLLRVGYPQGGSGTGYIDDLFIRCGSGLSTSDTLVDVGVQCLRPTSDSTGANWTYSTGATHYGVVDEAVPSETDYDSSSTVGAEQALGFSDLASTSYTIVGPVQMSVWAKKDDVGTRMIKLYCVSNGTTSYSDAMPVLDTGQYFVKQWALDPDGNKAWTASAVNAATFGYRLDS